MSEAFPERLVFVDDDQMIRDLVKEAMERADDEYILVTCMNGKELINRFNELQPDLIMLDLKMPQLSGPDTIEVLRERDGWEDTPFIFVTGQQTVQMIDDYKKLGVIGIIHKPFDTKELPDTVKSMWQAYQGVSDDENASEEGDAS